MASNTDTETPPFITPLPPRCEACGRRTERVEFCFGIGYRFGYFCNPRCP